MIRTINKWKKGTNIAYAEFSGYNHKSEKAFCQQLRSYIEALPYCRLLRRLVSLRTALPYVQSFLGRPVTSACLRHPSVISAHLHQFN
jgi:hypothetical protein